MESMIHTVTISLLALFMFAGAAVAAPFTLELGGAGVSQYRGHEAAAEPDGTNARAHLVTSGGASLGTVGLGSGVIDYTWKTCTVLLVIDFPCYRSLYVGLYAQLAVMADSASSFHSGSVAGGVMAGFDSGLDSAGTVRWVTRFQAGGSVGQISGIFSNQDRWDVAKQGSKEAHAISGIAGALQGGIGWKGAEKDYIAGLFYGGSSHRVQGKTADDRSIEDVEFTGLGLFWNMTWR